MQSYRRQDQHAGFSLVELMVAVAVLTICMLGIAQLVSISMQMNQFSSYTTVAANVARGRMAELKAAYNYELRTYNELSGLAAGDHGPFTVTLPAATAFQDNASFAVSWTVSDAGSGMKDVSVAVRPVTLNDPEADAPLVAKAVTLQARFAP